MLYQTISENKGWLRLLSTFPLERSNDDIINELLVDYIPENPEPDLRKRLNLMLNILRMNEGEKTISELEKMLE